MGILRRFLFDPMQETQELVRQGEEKLKQLAFLLVAAALFSGVCGWMYPVLLTPLYCIAASGLYDGRKFARLGVTAVMLLHVAGVLLRCLPECSFWLLAGDVGIPQGLCCTFFVGIVIYIYASPCITEYFQERHSS